MVIGLSLDNYWILVHLYCMTANSRDNRSFCAMDSSLSNEMTIIGIRLISFWPVQTFLTLLTVQKNP